MLGREAADVAIAALEELKVRTKAQIPVVSPAYLLLVSLNLLKALHCPSVLQMAVRPPVLRAVRGVIPACQMRNPDIVIVKCKAIVTKFGGLVLGVIEAEFCE